MKTIKHAALTGLVIAAILISYLVVGHIGYAHGFDAGYHAIETEANQD